MTQDSSIITEGGLADKLDMMHDDGRITENPFFNEILTALQLKHRIENKIKDIRNHPSDYEVACGEGETCTVAERTEDILQELLSKQPSSAEVAS